MTDKLYVICLCSSITVLCLHICLFIWIISIVNLLPALVSIIPLIWSRTCPLSKTNINNVEIWKQNNVYEHFKGLKMGTITLSSFSFLDISHFSSPEFDSPPARKIGIGGRRRMVGVVSDRRWGGSFEGKN